MAPQTGWSLHHQAAIQPTSQKFYSSHLQVCDVHVHLALRAALRLVQAGHLLRLGGQLCSREGGAQTCRARLSDATEPMIDRYCAVQCGWRGKQAISSREGMSVPTTKPHLHTVLDIRLTGVSRLQLAGQLSQRLLLPLALVS